MGQENAVNNRQKDKAKLCVFLDNDQILILPIIINVN